MIATQDPREIRGCAIIAKGDEPEELALNIFKIPSQNSNGKYIVKLEEDTAHCSCPDHKYRKITCKHIHAVKVWKALQEKLDSQRVEKIVDITCKFCGSPEIIKYGKKNGKQNYYCKTCKRKFVNNGDFQRLKFSPHIITLSLDLYFKGVSLRKIADHLKQFYELNISHVTVYNWIEKYIGILNDYVSTLEPEVSDTGHADEMMINIGGDMQWLWNIIDENTRFQLASVISRTRRIEDARRLFRGAKRTSRKKPKKIVTDGLHQYSKAIQNEFNINETKHIRNVGIRAKINNNHIERRHGTIRERNKVQRGLKKEDTPFIDGERIYYNYIRSNQALDGKTPAEVAGIDLELGKNKWLDLIKKAINHEN